VGACRGLCEYEEEIRRGVVLKEAGVGLLNFGV
jgi:hypothetical protein